MAFMPQRIPYSCWLLHGFLASLSLGFIFNGSPLSSMTEYVLVSQPAEGSVSVVEVNAITRQVIREARKLISAGLQDPSGLAVDHRRQRLYVADPKSHKVFMYHLLVKNGRLSVNQNDRYVAITDITPRWIALDDEGSLFCTDEQRSFIAEVPSKDLDQLQPGDDSTVLPRFRKLYDGENIRQVDKPGGLAVEGNTLFWGNRARGRPYGSLLRAPTEPESRRVRGVPGMIQSLSRNVERVYGVCASSTAVFYTGGERLVYGAKPDSYQTPAAATVRLDDYARPRGCVWDGDGTVYLADAGNNAVWSFPSSLHQFGIRQADKLANVQNPYGVAVFQPRLTLDAVGFLRGKSLRAAPAVLVAIVLMTLGHRT